MAPKWVLNLNNNTHTSLASRLREKCFVLKHEYEAKDVQSIVIKFRRHLCKGSMLSRSEQMFSCSRHLTCKKSKTFSYAVFFGSPSKPFSFAAQ